VFMRPRQGSRRGTFTDVARRRRLAQHRSHHERGGLACIRNSAGFRRYHRDPTKSSAGSWPVGLTRPSMESMLPRLLARCWTGGQDRAACGSITETRPCRADSPTLNMTLSGLQPRERIRSGDPAESPIWRSATRAPKDRSSLLAKHSLTWCLLPVYSLPRGRCWDIRPESLHRLGNRQWARA
jgi:hypothetical protein